jgi:hypothetical protein
MGINPGDVLLEGDLLRIPTTPTATASTGTPTSGTTETLDAVLGTYQFTAAASSRYRIIYSGLKFSGTAVADLYTVNIRNGGASTPTAASPLVATSAKYIPATGGAGQEAVWLSKTFLPAAGVVTLGAFAVRSTGSGVGTPIGDRELYVEYMGPA